MIQTKPVTVKLQLVQTTDVDNNGNDTDVFFLEMRRSDGRMFTCVGVDPQMYARLKRSLCLEDE